MFSYYVRAVTNILEKNFCFEEIPPSNDCNFVKVGGIN